VVKARWMSLVTATAFQAFPSMQARAFTVLSVLIGDSKLDDEFFFQILVALKNAILLSPDGDCVAVISMLRCMRKIIPGLIDCTLYLCHVFWLAVTLLQTSHIPYYVESMHIIQSVLCKLEAERAFVDSNVSSVLLRARSNLGDKLAGFDEISGFSFTDELSFSLSLAFLLYAVTQHQKLRHIAGDVIRECLCVVSRNSQVGSNVRVRTREVDPSLVGFVLGSLPFCATVASLRALLEDATVDIAYWESKGLFSGLAYDGYRCAVPFSLLGASDPRGAQLTIAFLVSMMELHAGDIPEKEILFALLADANEAHPAIVSETQSHYLTFSRCAISFVEYAGSFPNVVRIGLMIGGVMHSRDIRLRPSWPGWGKSLNPSSSLKTSGIWWIGQCARCRNHTVKIHRHHTICSYKSGACLGLRLIYIPTMTTSKTLAYFHTYLEHSSTAY
jgi:hypothetical protein